jgi:hypothetical protein
MMVRFHSNMPVRLWHGVKKKRALIYHIFKRCTGKAIQPDHPRLFGFLINTLGCMVLLYIYQG